VYRRHRHRPPRPADGHAEQDGDPGGRPAPPPPFIVAVVATPACRGIGPSWRGPVTKMLRINKGRTIRRGSRPRPCSRNSPVNPGRLGRSLSTGRRTSRRTKRSMAPPPGVKAVAGEGRDYSLPTASTASRRQTHAAGWSQCRPSANHEQPEADREHYSAEQRAERHENQRPRGVLFRRLHLCIIPRPPPLIRVPSCGTPRLPYARLGGIAGA
jgi:hypothetical protein